MHDEVAVVNTVGCCGTGLEPGQCPHPRGKSGLTRLKRGIGRRGCTGTAAIEHGLHVHDMHRGIGVIAEEPGDGK